MEEASTRVSKALNEGVNTAWRGEAEHATMNARLAV
jgi:hypothetical protein